MTGQRVTGSQGHFSPDHTGIAWTLLVEHEEHGGLPQYVSGDELSGCHIISLSNKGNTHTRKRL